MPHNAGLMPTFTVKLFPRESRFWLYHGAATAFIVCVTLASGTLIGQFDAFNASATVLWVLPYTLAVLGFRYLYLHRSWADLGMSQLIPLVVAYGFFTGMAVVTSISVMLAPYFWPQVSAGLSGVELFSHLLRTTVRHGLQGQLFISAWAFVYISASAAQRARESEVSNLRLQMNLKAAQLSQLTEQLNPHFLFNALNNIRFMIHEEGARAEAMLVSLSEILRYSLESSQRGSRALSEELEVIDAYLALMRLQLEERLDFRLELAPGLQGCQVPPMALQLLVENAIKHGIEPLPNGGRLILQALDAGPDLLLKVGNDRPGTAVSPSKTRRGLGFGLPNVEQRLRLLYGRRASLKVIQSEHFFEVELRLPKSLERE